MSRRKHISRAFLCVILLLLTVSFLNFRSINNGSQVNQDTLAKCQGRKGSIMYQLDTKLGLHSSLVYDGSHWFHMAEKFLSQYSMLREGNYLNRNASEIIFNFDKAGFEDDLNGFTRFLLYLGTAFPGFSATKLHFVHIPSSNFESVSQGESVAFGVQDLKEHQSIDLSLNASGEGKFDNKDTTLFVQDYANNKVCAHLMGKIGQSRPKRGHWFTSEQDVLSLRENIRTVCPANRTLLNYFNKQKQYKMVIYQRDISRKLQQTETLIERIRSKLPDQEQWEIKLVVHSSARGVCRLTHLLHNVDVLVTPHGFQSMLVLFLPLPAILFEVFPFRYHRNVYRKLSEDLGMAYGMANSPPLSWSARLGLSLLSPVRNKHGRYEFLSACLLCRRLARSQNVIMPDEGIDQLVQVIQHNQRLLDLPMSTVHGGQQGAADNWRNSNTSLIKLSDAAAIRINKMTKRHVLYTAMKGSA